VAVCEHGTNGVRMTSIDLGAFPIARRLVRALNETLGIDAVAEHAMLVGCLRGWRREVAGPGSMHAESQRSVSVERHARDRTVLH